MASEECARPLPLSRSPLPPPLPLPPQPRLLNDSYCEDVDHGQYFAPFSRLPAELRMCIWRAYLQRHRIISIVLGQLREADGAPSFYSETNQLGSLVSGKNYYLALTRQHHFSPLLSVNSEARAVALSFYRLQFPCSIRGSSHSISSSTHYPRSPPINFHYYRCLYMSPEYDFVHVQLSSELSEEDDPPPELLADFLHDCKAYDPRGHGVLNLVVGDGNISKFKLPNEPLLVAPQALETFKSTLTNLNNLFFYMRAKPEARQMTGELISDRIRYNRGVPMESHLSEDIVFLGNDPRRIEHDLGLVCVGWDPRANLWAWREMERKFDIASPSQAVGKAQFLLTSRVLPPRNGLLEIRSCADAKKYVQHEAARWPKLFDKKTGVFGGMDNPDTPEQVADAVHAVGFWLLDLDAFGPMPEGAGPLGFRAPLYRWDFKHDAVLTAHRPQLGLFTLDRE